MATSLSLIFVSFLFIFAAFLCKEEHLVSLFCAVLATMFLIAGLLVNDDSTHEIKSATSVQIDTIYTICNEDTIVMYNIKYIK